jgi:hypothetical protein
MTAVTTVRVTDKHIEEGRPGDACACALSLAVVEALSSEGAAVRNVHVGAPGFMDNPYAEWCVRVTLYDEPHALTAEISRPVIDWIALFDNGQDVEPIEISLTWKSAS